MILSVLLLTTGLAFAAPVPKAPAPKAPVRASEETLRGMLLKLRHHDAWKVREAVIGDAEELRDAVVSGTGTAKARFADRLPGMAKDPFDICRDLSGCRQAPQSLHVEDQALIDDAFLALARPWFKLQEARGKAVTLTVDPGTGVRLELEGLPTVTLEAGPAPTGGFDVTLNDGPEAAQIYAAERAAVLPRKEN